MKIYMVYLLHRATINNDNRRTEVVQESSIFCLV